MALQAPHSRPRTQLAGATWPLHGPLTPADHLAAHSTLPGRRSDLTYKGQRWLPGEGLQPVPPTAADQRSLALPGLKALPHLVPEPCWPPPSVPAGQRGWLPLGVVGRVLRRLLQQSHVAQHAGEDEEHGQGVRAPETKHTAASGLM